MIDSDRLSTLLHEHPAVGAGIAGLFVMGAVVAIGSLVRAGRRHGITAERAGTLLSAALATGVSAQGMWVFFGRSLHLTLSLRIMFFAFLEIMVLTSALRARAAQQDGGSAGADGIAMWVLTCLSAVLAATDADDIGTVAIRLTAPLVAAWGWERSMALERRRSGKRDGVHWRITPERILIRLGLADPTDRTASQVATARRLVDVALAADHARTLRATGVGGRRMEGAVRKLRKSMRRAVEDGGLVDNERAPREVLLDNLRVLSGATALLDLELADPWIAEPAARPGVAPDRTPISTAARPDMLLGNGSVPVRDDVVPRAAHGVRPNGVWGNGLQLPDGSAAAVPSGNPAAMWGNGFAGSDPRVPIPGVAHDGDPDPNQVQGNGSGAGGAAAADPVTDRTGDLGFGPGAQAEPTANRVQGNGFGPGAQAEPIANRLQGNGFGPGAQAEPVANRVQGNALGPGAPVANRVQGNGFGPGATSRADGTGNRVQDAGLEPGAAPSGEADPDASRAQGRGTAPAENAPLDPVGQSASEPEAGPDETSQPRTGARRRTGRPPADSAPARVRPNPLPDDESRGNGPMSAGQQKVRRDPAVRARVRELRAADKPTAEIAAELGVSTRTVGRILADMEAAAAQSAGPWPPAPKPVPPAPKPVPPSPPVLNPADDVNPARALISSWDTGFHAINATAIANANAKHNANNGSQDI
ncbi:hypothetical protein [Nocardia stercoris]|uniref:Uncharacterized protein n=1 Tax=Nocardia stercoris TaxID=2483361 RepID=A0A3M2L7X1_9NOCA|nr:hypothetical protein [Nocardia stercoris]RMI30638.1 hypothetical protein EBN03_21510 [Nocardia stercoris]